MYPLVLTLRLDPAAQRRFDDERTALFPPGRTQVGAHLTLFHAVPGNLLPNVLEAVHAERAQAPLAVEVVGLRNLGRGVAYELACPALLRLRDRLAQLWWAHLTPQDQQPFRPHVTVQSKVDAPTAKATLASLSASFVPFEVTGSGIDVWRYVGGPWEPVETVVFDG